GGFVSGVAPVPGTTQVWVDGDDQNGNGFAARWTGSGWETYFARAGGNGFGNVAAVSSSSAWIVGAAVIDHWDGSAWTEVPNPSATDTTLLGVAARSDSDAWAVGYSHTG